MSAAFSFSSGTGAPGAGAQAFAGIGPNGQPIAMAQAGNQGAVAGAGQNNPFGGPQGPRGPHGPHGPRGQMAKMMNFLKGFMMGKMLSQMMNGGMQQGPGQMCGCNANPAFGGMGVGNNFAMAGAIPGGGAPMFGNTLGTFLG